MNSGRVVAAGVVGGVVMFIWGAVSHMALPLGEMGIKSMPREAESLVMPALKFSIPERGFYFFPGMDKNDKSPEAEKAWMEKYKTGPRGVLIFDPVGGEMMSATQLGTELGSNILASLFLAFVLAQVPGSTGKRTLFGAAMGLFAWASIDVSYWNWYRFPGEFTVAQGIDQGVGGLLTGLAIAWVLSRGSGAKPQMI